MQYLVLLYGDESLNPQPGTPEWDADMEGYMAFGELAGPAIVTGDALWGNDAVRTIQHDGSKVRVTNGPFAETTEGLGGYYVLEAPTLDDTIELVRNIPAVNYGAAEIRPLVQHFDRSEGMAQLADGEARYIASIQGPQTDDDIPGTDAWEQMGKLHGEFTEQAGTAVYGGGAVQPSSMATTIKVRDGELLVTDGPYSETMEIVGGYYLVRGAADEAAEVAARIPVNDGGRVELRQIMELGG